MSADARNRRAERPFGELDADLDWQTGVVGEARERPLEAAVAQYGRVQAPGEFAQLDEPVAQFC